MWHLTGDRALPSEGKGQKFESSRARQLNQWVAQIFPETPKRQTHHKLTNRTGALACDRRASRHIVALNCLRITERRARPTSPPDDVSILILCERSLKQSIGRSAEDQPYLPWGHEPDHACAESLRSSRRFKSGERCQRFLRLFERSIPRSAASSWIRRICCVAVAISASGLGERSESKRRAFAGNSALQGA